MKKLLTLLFFSILISSSGVSQDLMINETITTYKERFKEHKCFIDDDGDNVCVRAEKTSFDNKGIHTTIIYNVFDEKGICFYQLMSMDQVYTSRIVELLNNMVKNDDGVIKVGPYKYMLSTNEFTCEYEVEVKNNKCLVHIHLIR